jgi:hypothetical protein
MTAAARQDPIDAIGPIGAMPRVSDELAWELLRDEWELLLAIGAGPTTVRHAAARVGDCPDAVGARVATLVQHGLIRSEGDGFAMVPAFHKRQEGMASYLRELVLERVDLAGAVPLGAAVRYELGTEAALTRFVERAETTLLPQVVAAASGPESDDSERFLAVFAVSSACPRAEARVGEGGAGSSGLIDNVLRILRATALERSHDVTHGASKLWVAEMRVTPDVASGIAEAMEAFVNGQPSAHGPGAAAMAVWPVRVRTGARATVEERS